MSVFYLDFTQNYHDSSSDHSTTYKECHNSSASTFRSHCEPITMANLINLDLDGDQDADFPELDMASSQPIRTDKNFYKQRPITLPDNFLRSDPAALASLPPLLVKPIDFRNTALPEYADAYACVIDNVLTPEECTQLIQLAEDSVADEARGKSGTRIWKPALINVGDGLEIFDSSYRNSDRIVWDHQEVVNRIWDRITSRAPVIQSELSSVAFEGSGWSVNWDFASLNQRMRFLRYGSHQFFRPHCDGAFREVRDGKQYSTFYTVHLYLNDSVAEVGEKADLSGGATSFLSRNEKRRLSVHPKAGRVLIFQHERLYHAGDDVLKGTKYTVRMDVLYVRGERMGARKGGESLQARGGRTMNSFR